ncbi:hypothetical protein [Luteimonas sp. BLCC-B24]|uniref:hypothetical protein n=1 Tax=Luteimonas sp. BLCC-B24 TaxID=3025317 RepID=UPI00234C1270|nr:hypothetical protein [Luteimonas sp. BLCC-B24]
MSERSEFGLRAPLTEKRRGPPRLHAADRVRRRDFLVPFWSFKKGLARAAGESCALASFACLAWPRLTAKNRAFALFARLTFVLSKVSKTAFAGREPTRLRRAGPLCSSPDAAHWDLYGSAAQTRCAQTWAALRPRQTAVLGSLYGSNFKGWKPSQAKPKAKAKAKGEGKGHRQRQGMEAGKADAEPQAESGHAAGVRFS